MTYEDFFYDTWENIETYEVPNELYSANEEAFDELTYELHRINKMSGLIPPNVAARVIVLSTRFKLSC